MTAKIDAPALAEALENLLCSVPPGHARPGEEEAFDRERSSAQDLLDRYRVQQQPVSYEGDEGDYNVACSGLHIGRTRLQGRRWAAYSPWTVDGRDGGAAAGHIGFARSREAAAALLVAHAQLAGKVAI